MKRTYVYNAALIVTIIVDFVILIKYNQYSTASRYICNWNQHFYSEGSAAGLYFYS